MKKLAFAVFVGIFCLGATSAFAQTKKETTQEKILRLEVENRVLNERVTSLTQEIASLQSQLAAAKAKDQPKKAEAPKADERAVLQARIVSLERQAAATQAHEQARLINRDTDFVSNINKHIPWTVKYIRGSEIRSMYEDSPRYMCVYIRYKICISVY